MLNSNSGIDPSSARAFGSSFPAGQNQGGANAFGLGGTPYFDALLLFVCRNGSTCSTVQFSGGIPGLQNYNMQAGLQNRYSYQHLDHNVLVM